MQRKRRVTSSCIFFVNNLPRIYHYKFHVIYASFIHSFNKWWIAFDNSFTFGILHNILSNIYQHFRLDFKTSMSGLRKLLCHYWTRMLCRGPETQKSSAKALTRAAFGKDLFIGHSAKSDGSGHHDPTGLICRGSFFAEGSWGWPSANSVFAECLGFGPRQNLRSLAKHVFPVVLFHG